MLKNNFSNLFKKHGFYILTGVCVAALAAAIGLISVSTKTFNSKNTTDNESTFITADNNDTSTSDDANVHITEVTSEDQNTSNDKNDSSMTDTQTANTQNSDTQNADSQNVADADGTSTNKDAVDANTTAVFTAFDDAQTLSWPVSGAILMDYSMNTTTYFKTLNQYQCNPALLIAADVNSEVHCAYNGTVESISNTAELGLCVTINVGNDYRMIYGQLKDVPVTEGQAVTTGSVLGNIAQPTRYYLEEGPHLYFEITRDDIPVDPKLYLETADANS